MIKLTEVYNILLNAYGPQHWWPANTPFEMMTGAILTQNTAWSNVEKALLNFNGKLSPRFVLDAPDSELAEIIRPSGFFNQKAVRLKSLARWFGKYDFDIEKLRRHDAEGIRAELLSLNGVGRETADSILLYALLKPYFVVDAYTRRLLERLGFEPATDYDDIRHMIEATLPRDVQLYNEFHALIVKHAKLHCKKAPICAECPLAGCCAAFAGA